MKRKYTIISLLLVLCTLTWSIATGTPVADSLQASNKSKAEEVMDMIEKANRYIDFITSGAMVELPVGMKKKMGNSKVTIGISKAKFYAQYTELTVYCKVDLPQGKSIFFGGDHIKLSKSGGIIGDATLVLLGNVTIPFGGGNMQVVLKGGQDMQTGDPRSQTYATLECNGIKEVSLAADVLFPKNMLVPLDNSYNPVNDGTASVKGSFHTVITDWNDILAEISLSPFAVKGLEQFAIVVNKAVFDFSDTRNSPDVSFPSEYENIIPGNETLWRGVYVNKLQVILPREFSKRGDNSRVSFEADRMLVDNLGLTGTFIGNNILQNGNASGWAFSVNRLAIDIKTNHLKSAAFNGNITLPLSASADTSGNATFAYDAIISPGNQYLMRVKTKNDLDFDLWQANAHIDSSSYVELVVKDHHFRPKAVLNGSLDISVLKQNNNEAATPGKSIANIKGVEFQQLVLQTETPYLQAAYFGYKGEARIANFPVVLSDIALSATGEETALQFGVQVNLMQGKLTASTKLSVVGEMRQNSDLQRYRYKRLDINALAIDGKFGGFAINGNVAFNRNHPVMGDGFAGNLKMTLKLGKEITVDAKAAFGSKHNDSTSAFRYWYVDAMATGFVIPAGPFNITGIGGGAYYHMTKEAGKTVDTAVSPTKIGYVPDPSMGLGLKGMVAFNVGTSELAKGEAALEMLFTSSGGMANIGLAGKVYFIPGSAVKEQFNNAQHLQEKLEHNLSTYVTNTTGVNYQQFSTLARSGNFVDLAKQSYPDTDNKIGENGQISAFVGINYDFLNHVLHANLDLYMNIAGGIIRGRGANNRAGWAVMHFAPQDWYVYLGTPSDRLGLKMGIGSISAETGSYFMAGTKIPGSPAPPQAVADILGTSLQELDYMRDLNALGDGRGFAFGTDVSVNTGDLRFLMFYASFQAGLGFDIMLKDYGPDAQCKNHSGPIGVNGWYANGQAYAYLQGELGIEVSLMFIHKRISIIKAGAAVLLQAQLPNPAWFRGYVGGNFSVLGGLVKGRFRFKVTIGEQCELVNGGALDGIKVISDITPADKSTQIDVFAAPQAIFNMPVDKPFTIDDDQGTKTYRIKLDKYQLLKDGQPIAGKMNWNDRHDAVTYESAEILPPNTPITAVVSVNFEQQNDNGWAAVYEKGQKAVESRQVSFTTGTAPDNIPLNNIVYTYPVVDQQFFLPKEYKRGYTQLRRGQAYLFSNTNFLLQAQFAASDAMLSNTFSYDSANRRVNFELPALRNKQTYSYTLAGVPPAKGTDNIVRQTANTDTDNNDIQVTNNKAQGIVLQNKPHTYLTYQFSTSRYNNFEEKMSAKSITHPVYEIIFSDVGALQADIRGDEAFDKTELSGSDGTDNVPLIQPEAILSDVWFTKHIQPLIYADYPPAPGLTLSRDTAVLGFPPVRGLDVMTWYSEMAAAEPGNSLLVSRLPYRYYLGYYYRQDFSDLQYKVVNQYIDHPSLITPVLQRFMESAFPIMKGGKYKVQYRYVLPGNIPNSAYEFEFINPVK
ncbi:hypothetical protein [Chitinophaga flava]|uniref:Uncharacterized protein n=1 Tax=Chitinophaga flava TaxID=2259036 RepID=A0A365XTI5_9BACT|nr:hypothetical protein [Chitinophaga flava]RBL89428.1 hypothetical protein DF182_23200 [Chitinophaga flava]